MHRRLSRMAIGAALAGAVVLAFAPALRAPFDFDDDAAIEHNLSIRQLWPPSVALAPPGLGTAVSGRPVANYSFALNYAINRWFGIGETGSEGGTIGFHAANILLHLVAGLLLFAIVRRTILFGRVPDHLRATAADVAGIVAGLWLIHPLQTDAVDYLSQRTELLVSVCYLATIYCALRAWHASNAWAAAAILVCLLGMGSKEVMLTAPLTVILYDRAFLAPDWRSMWAARRRTALYCFLLGTSGLSIWLIARGGRAGTVGFHAGLTWYQYLYSQGWAITRYLRLALWPNALIYDYGQQPIRGPGAIPGLALLSLLGGLTIAAWRRPKWRWAGFLGAAFFLLLAPSSSVVPIQTEIAAERRVYLALAPVIVLLVIGAMHLWRRPALDRYRGAQLVAGALLTGALATAMIGATFERSRLYRDPELLWRDAAMKRPDNARAFYGVAVAELRRDPSLLGDADSLLGRAVRLDSTLVLARVARAAIAIKGERLADAESLLTNALRIVPGDSAATDQLGRLLVASGQPVRALPHLAQLARAFPSGRTFTALGTAYLIAGNLDSAVVVLTAAVRMDSTEVDAMRYLGGALIEDGRGGDAVPYLTRAAALDPASSFTLGMLAVAFAEAHRVDEAVRAADGAVERAGNDEPTRVFAGRALQIVGRFAAAAKYLEEAVRISPNDPQALTRLGVAEASLGDRPRAGELFRRALAIDPDYVPAHRAMTAFK